MNVAVKFSLGVQEMLQVWGDKSQKARKLLANFGVRMFGNSNINL